MLSPHGLLDSFAHQLKRLEVYRLRERRPQRALREDLLLTEAQARVRQALYALVRFRVIEVKPNHRDVPDCPDLSLFAAAVLRHDPGAPELEFYAEAFYQAAFRAYAVLRQVPEFKAFKPVGVRSVRNWFIQHGENTGGRLARNYRFDIPEGFRIKPFGPEVAAEDAGLYPNAEEFISALAKRLDVLLAS
jgi:hypothetical protein